MSSSTTPHSSAAEGSAPPGKQVPYENKSQLSPHALRRSFAVLMRSEGTPLEDIAEVLNPPQKRKTINAFSV